MKLKQNIILITLMIVVQSLVAQKVSVDEARTFATRFFVQQKGASKAAKAELALCGTDQGDTLLYVFNIGNRGFVMVSGDYREQAVLAFSTEGNFVEDPENKALQAWIDQKVNRIRTLRNTQIQQQASEWSAILHSANTSSSSKAKAVAPLLTTRWNQDAGYNDQCPVFSSGPGGRCYAGCVATAMGQIMNYYAYPSRGTGSHAYYHPYYVQITADFDTAYDWSAMTNSIRPSSTGAISLLLFHCGVAVDMDYNPGGSGAQTAAVPAAMQSYFAYHPSIEMLEMSSFTLAEWKSILIQNLDLQRPVLYAGSGSSGGHAWVLDGYQDTSFFHFNWGWGGANNGYFTLDSLDSGNGVFTNDQRAVVNIMPATAKYCLDGSTHTAASGSFGDGSGYSMYRNNTECEWLIEPDQADKIRLTFSAFKTEHTADVVKVYDGNSVNDPLLGVYSGNTLPPSLVSSGGKMLVVFSTDSINQDAGWELSYETVSLGVDDFSSGILSVYPIPATDELCIVLSDKRNDLRCLNVYKATGEKVLSKSLQNVSKQKLNIDVSGLESGFYVVEVCADHSVYQKKFIKI